MRTIWLAKPPPVPIRIISNLKYDEHCKPYFKKNKILTLKAIYIFETIIYSTKANKIRRAEIHTHNMRNKNAINLPYHRLKKSQNHLDYIRSKLYNALPLFIKGLQTPKLHIFKKYLRNFLTSNPIYTIAEYIDIICQQNQCWVWHWSHQGLTHNNTLAKNAGTTRPTVLKNWITNLY